MRKLCCLLGVGLLGCIFAADWLNEGGDPQRTGFQKREAALSPTTVKNLRLLWKRKLEPQNAALSAPIILGHLVTHRGTVELVFVAGGSDLYAVDGDFGTVFWKRHLEGPPHQGAIPTPVITPAAPGAEDQDDDDAPQPLRPLYVLAGDGRLHAIHPGDGHDLAKPWNFVSPNARPSSLNLSAGTIYTTTREGIWSLGVATRETKATFQPQPNGGAPITVAVDGSIVPPRDSAEAAFEWKGRSVTAGVGKDGRLFVGSVQAGLAVDRFHGPVASFEDRDGTRWIYASSRRVVAFRMIEKSGALVLTRAWQSSDLGAPGAPVVAGGLVFVFARGELYALDAASGNRLYSSGPVVARTTVVSVLAVANGHVCFTASDGTLYCFGFPVDI